MQAETMTFILQLLFIHFITTLIHELGHFIMLKIYNVKVTEIRVFSKPLFWIFPIKNTFFSIGWLPLGGATFHNQAQYYNLNNLQKVNIILAGVALNYLTAEIAAFFYSFTGLYALKLFCILSAIKILNLIPLPGSDGSELLTLYKLKHARRQHN